MMRKKIVVIFIIVGGLFFTLACEPGEEETYTRRVVDDDIDETDDDLLDDDTNDDIDDDTDDEVDDDADDDTSDDDADDDIDDDSDDDIDDDVDDDCNDPYEPNDSNPGYYLGDMTQQETFLYALIGSPYDIDKFYMWVDDPWYINFGVEAWLDGVPPTCNYNLYLYECFDSSCMTRSIRDSSTNPAGQSEHVYFGGSIFEDDEGFYQVEVVSEEGYECNLNYMLRVRGPRNKGESALAN